jgi:palmitoyl transferase
MIFIPAVTWHARLPMTKKTDRYNERPWGAGFGVSRWDDKGNWHGMYLMAFKDSLISGSLSAAMAGRKPGVP